MPSYSLDVFCDDQTTIYIDGDEWYVDRDWTARASVKVPITAQTIAIQCHDGGGGYGIVGELKDQNGNFVTVTGSSWRCSDVWEEGWVNTHFQGGENWQIATIHDNSWLLNNSPFNQLTSPARKVIWSDTPHNTAYCRKEIDGEEVDGGYTDFGDWSECSAECEGGTQTRTRTCTNPAPANGGLDCKGDASETRECNTQDCPTYYLDVFCDDQTTIYIDGVEWYVDRDWTARASVKVPLTAQTIAIQCHDGGGGYGIVGELKDMDGNFVTVTGSSWRCSDVWEEGWVNTHFQGGENWQIATIHDNSWLLNNSPFNELTSPARQVIWSDTPHNTAYCRKEIDGEEVDGGYTDFGDWSECSAECDGGTQTRTRTCTNPAPANGGLDCKGDASETRECNIQDCPTYYLDVFCDDQTTIYVDGVEVYSDTDWTTKASLKVPITVQTIAIKCHDGGGGYGIVGELKDMDGNDVTITGSSWRCSDTEEEGWVNTHFQGGENWQIATIHDNSWLLNNSPFNELTSPARQVIWSDTPHNTAYCRKEIDGEEVDGGYTDFGDWSECSAECDGGTQTRTRTCTNPAPANGGLYCKGDASETRECNIQDCPTYYLDVFCDDQTTIYVDGVEVYSDTDWTTKASLKVPITAQTIAIKCHDGGGGYGIVGELKDMDGNDVTVTGSSWRCSDTEEEGWVNTHFLGGENWQIATIHDNSWLLNNSPFNELTSPARQVIWSDTPHNTAYCRKEIDGEEVDGGYTDFGDWSECSAECDGGTQTRTRTCTNPAPANGGLDCKGDASETRECNTQDCPTYYLDVFCDDQTTIYVDGVEVYSDTDWTARASLKVPLTARTIAIKCHDGGGGYGIVGELTDMDGNVVTSTGSSWSCSRDGEYWRIATIHDNDWMLNNSPFNELTSSDREVIWSDSPHGTAYCRKEIARVDGGYSDFGDWSVCSAECGGGTQTRSRTCTNPAPVFGGADCVGDSSETRECNTQGCPGEI